MLLSAICFCPCLEEFPLPSLANALIQRYRFLKAVSDKDCLSQSLPLFYYILEYRGFDKSPGGVL